MLGIVNAVMITITLPLPAGGIRVRLLHHLYDAGHTLAVALLSAAAVGAWQRWGPRRPLLGYAALAVVSLSVGAAVLSDDLSGLASRCPGPLLLWQMALICVVALTVPVVAAVTLRLVERPEGSGGSWATRLWARRYSGVLPPNLGSRALVGLVGLGLAVTNHFVLANDYAGLHLFCSWTAAILLGVAASVELPALRSRRGRLALFAALSILAALSIAVRPQNRVALELGKMSGSSLTSFILRIRLDQSAAISPAAGEWFADRSAMPPIPPSASPLLPRGAIVILITIDALRADVVADATPESWAGYEMVSLDASTVSGPGAEGSDVRLHCVLRLHDLRVRDVCVTSASEGETFKNFVWEADTLVIADRGYANAPGIIWVVDHGAAVLVRVNRGALPLSSPSGKAIDALAWCRSLQDNVPHERPAVVVHGKGKAERKVEGRLIGFHLPPEQAHAARERVRREEGPAVSKEKLDAAEYVILFTTTPASRMSADRCVDAYRLRWQVELQFKRWKSLCHFDKLPNYRDDTMLSWVTAKLLLGLLLDRVAAAQDGGDATTRPGARQAWKITSLLWPLVLAALLPVDLASAIALVPAMSRRLDSLDDAGTTRQIDVFRWQQEEVDESG